MTVPMIREAEPTQALAVSEGANSITNLLTLAVQRGTPVAELKELVDLHERMEKREAVKAFAAAMAAFQKECPQIKKSSTASVATKGGSKWSYTYAELDEIAGTVGPVLARNGLSYTWDCIVDKTMLTAICIVRHVEGHSIEAKFTLPTEASSPGMNAQQAVGAALTYAKRQSLCAALGLTMTDNDTDAVDPTPITDDQVTVLIDLINDTGANQQKFLEFMNAVSITLIRKADYQKAVAALQRKRAKS